MDFKEISDILNNFNKAQAIINDEIDLNKYYDKKLDSYIFPSGVMIMIDLKIDKDIYSSMIFSTNLKCKNIYNLTTAKFDNLICDNITSKAIVVMENIIAKEVVYQNLFSVNGDKKVESEIKK